MSEILDQIAKCVEFGKINETSPYPPDMKGQKGASELTRTALDEGIAPTDVLTEGLIVGMQKIGAKFRENKVFVPQVLMSAKAMSAAMDHLKPYFTSGAMESRGTFVIGTVEGDLHDIGKNLVSMMVEGNGYKVVDLGTDVKADKFIEAIEAHPGCHVGLSALLTTTMTAMKNIAAAIKEHSPETKVCIGGAPVNQDFCNTITADFYSPEPQGLVEYLNGMRNTATA